MKRVRPRVRGEGRELHSVGRLGEDWNEVQPDYTTDTGVAPGPANWWATRAIAFES